MAIGKGKNINSTQDIVFKFYPIFFYKIISLNKIKDRKGKRLESNYYDLCFWSANYYDLKTV